MTALYAIGATVGVSLISLVGILLFMIDARFIKRAMLYFISFSTGALLGDVFIHILPEMAEAETGFAQGMLMVLGGLIFSFAVEKFIHWRHCHHEIDDADHDHHYHPLGILSLVGDGMHNLIDGIAIAASFIASPTIGFSTTLALIFHEIPQEVGDFAVLLHSGFSRKKALFFNFLSALTAIFGAVVTLLLSNVMVSVTPHLLPFAAGNLLYIAVADLIPELHKETGIRQSFLQILVMIIGMATMYALLLIE